MKHIVKSVGRFGWQSTAWMRRPVQRKLDAYLSRLIRNAVQTCNASARLPPGTKSSTSPVDPEISLVLDGLFRELFRLQMQLEVRQQTIQDKSDRSGDDR